MQKGSRGRCTDEARGAVDRPILPFFYFAADGVRRLFHRVSSLRSVLEKGGNRTFCLSPHHPPPSSPPSRSVCPLCHRPPPLRLVFPPLFIRCALVTTRSAVYLRVSRPAGAESDRPTSCRTWPTVCFFTPCSRRLGRRFTLSMFPLFSFPSLVLVCCDWQIRLSSPPCPLCQPFLLLHHPTSESICRSGGDSCRKPADGMKRPAYWLNNCLRRDVRLAGGCRCLLPHPPLPAPPPHLHCHLSLRSVVATVGRCRRGSWSELPFRLARLRRWYRAPPCRSRSRRSNRLQGGRFSRATFPLYV